MNITLPITLATGWTWLMLAAFAPPKPRWDLATETAFILFAAATAFMFAEAILS